MTELSIAFEWQRWAAENLLRGASAQEVVDALSEEDVPKQQAQALVSEIIASPIFAAARGVGPSRTQEVLRQDQKQLIDFEVEVRSGLSGAEFHRHCRAANRPIVLTDFLSGSPALDRWSFEWFAQTFAGVPMAYRDICDGAPETREMPVDALVALFETAERPADYYSMSRNHVLRQPAFSRLFDDLRFKPGYLNEMHRRRATSLWFGPAGTLTPLHHDVEDVFLTQIVGRKRVQLIPPVCENHLGRFRSDHMVSERHIDALLSTGVQVHEVQIGPGETLFIPIGWYHRVLALEPSISLSICVTPRD